MILCEKCGRRPARFCAVDEPEQECARLFGDRLAGVLLCRACLARTTAQGPWSWVEEFGDPPPGGAAA